MITVAGFNTAIDCLIRIDRLTVGDVHRAHDVRRFIGGKGVHVAQTIAALGERVQLVGLIDAAHRNEATRLLSERGVLFHAVEIEHDLRSCISIRDADGRVTELLDPGPEIADAHRSALMQALLQAIVDSHHVVLSGSLPRGFDDATYADIALHVASIGKRCLVDASGAALARASAARPFLVKPNRDEAESLGQAPLRTDADALRFATGLRAAGVSLPIVTLGDRGVIGVDDSGAWHAAAKLDATPRNTVGSGDCLLAGVTVGLERGMALGEMLALGAACGAANAMNDETGYVTAADVDYWRGRVVITRLYLA